MRTSPWQLFWGTVLILFGALFLLNNLGWLAFSVGDIFRYGWPLILVAIGVMILLGRWGHRGDWHVAPAGLGDRRANLAGQEIRDAELKHGLGDFDVDLTGAKFPEGTARVRVELGVGDLDIFLPKDVAMHVKARAGLGKVSLFDRREDGISPVIEFTSPDYATAARKFELEATVGLGDVEIRQMG